MISRIQLSTLLAVVVVAWAVALVASGITVSSTWLHPYSMVVGVLVLAIAVFDKWAWRLRLLQPWFLHMPDLNGTWRASLEPTGNDGASTTNAAPLMCYMVVRQTYSSISMRLLTEKSASELLAARITQALDGTFSIVAVFRATPRLSVRLRNPIHHGAFVLTVRGWPPDSLDGQYWTDRSTQGEMKLTDRKRKMFHTFEEAQAAFNDRPSLATDAHLQENEKHDA